MVIWDSKILVPRFLDLPDPALYNQTYKYFIVKSGNRMSRSSFSNTFVSLLIIFYYAPTCTLKLITNKSEVGKNVNDFALLQIFFRFKSGNWIRSVYNYCKHKFSNYNLLTGLFINEFLECKIVKIISKNFNAVFL